VHPQLDFSLGAKLVQATIGAYHSFGADEAMAWPYVSTWSPSRLAGGIWAAVASYDGRYLNIPASTHLPKLIAAAVGKNVLTEVLSWVRDMLDSSLERIPSGLAGAGNDFFALAASYTGSDQLLLTAFGTWLRTRQAEQ
jgi:hypothetical protein